MSVDIDDHMNLAGQPASWPVHWLFSVPSDAEGRGQGRADELIEW